ncbi:uncharacterized protein LOC141713976 [Apium graveolens]|uniref:uncharacterized protein LOC141713976 n=1 Tax=Apium graveolens TaxID=4045 RepID=UPI003D7A39C1
MDKSWISKDWDSLEFEIGVEEFLIFAEENCKDPKRIPCPCEKSTRSTRSSIGSTRPASDQPIEHFVASETFEVCEAAFNSGNYDKDSYDFQRFVVDAEQPFFEGSECTKLESMLKLHNWKARFGISDTAFTELLSSVGSILPKDNVLPPNTYEAKKTLSLVYIKIHLCPNDCILYRGIHSNASQCPHCKLSHWKVRKNGQLRVNVPAKRINDDKMRHPDDSPSWRNIDYRWSAFGSESRNIRLALSADGINPHTNGLVNRYTCWPVVLVTYNLPPWLCMKRKFMMLSVLVPGPHEPGNNIDVYLQPLIDDLKKLWEEGEPNVYDAYSKSYFTLKAILLWTINDFPAYGNLSGCVNKGYKSYLICGDDTVAKYLSHSRKMCFQGHRRYLPRQHPYRRQKAAFNGQQELGNACQPLSGEEVLARQKRIDFCFGKEVKKSKKVEYPWKKKSVFFELEYWKYHHVRHCLDVMHIEKNVCDNLLGTLLNMRKSKDSEVARRDMIDMGVRHDLAPQVGEKKTYLPPSPFTLSKVEKKKVLNSFLSMKLPSGHGSNIKNCVSMSDLKIYGLKSHDCHILLQQLLPVAIRSVLPKNVRVTIIRLCFFFNALCSKVVDVSKLDKLQSDKCVYVDRYFIRWMYAFERFNKVLKSYVRNRYYPEGCMAESYLKEESVEFCTEFMSQTCTTAGIPVEQGKQSGPLSAAIIKVMEEKEMHKEYLDEIYRGKKKSVHWLMGEHNRLFADCEMKGNPDAVSEMIRWLAGKPSFSVLTYQVQVSSAKDLNPIESDMTFYGIILEVWELDYHEFKAPLFLCKWAENDKGIKINDLGFTLVDFNRQGHKKDKYVSVDQVNQVFYIKDLVDPTWSIVLTSTTRDYQELYNDDDLGNTIMEHPPFCSNIPASDVTNEDVAHSIRPNVEGIWL